MSTKEKNTHFIVNGIFLNIKQNLVRYGALTVVTKVNCLVNRIIEYINIYSNHIKWFDRNLEIIRDQNFNILNQSHSYEKSRGKYKKNRQRDYGIKGTQINNQNWNEYRFSKTYTNQQMSNIDKWYFITIMFKNISVKNTSNFDWFFL